MVDQNDVKEGTGGLWLDPPDAPTESEGVGFAPNLSAGAPDVLSMETHESGASVYPISWRLLQGLKDTPSQNAEISEPGESKDAPDWSLQNKVGDETVLSVKPEVFRVPQPVITAPVVVEPAAKIDLEKTDERLSEMTDMVLVGSPDESGNPEIHLAFKSEIFGGFHLRMEKQAEGLFLHFSVDDAHGRRGVSGQAEAMIARLRARNIRVVGWGVVLNE